jgi:hypothetical protein
VEIANILILASASGFAMLAKIPVRPKSSTPSTFSTFHPASVFISDGTKALSQTIESSLGERLIEKNYFDLPNQGLVI